MVSFSPLFFVLPYAMLWYLLSIIPLLCLSFAFILSFWNNYYESLIVTNQ